MGRSRREAGIPPSVSAGPREGREACRAQAQRPGSPAQAARPASALPSPSPAAGPSPATARRSPGSACH